MNGVIDKISEIAFDSVIKYWTNVKKREEWKNAVEKACRATEQINENITEVLLKSLAIQRHFVWLMSQKPKDGIYRSFILTLALELEKYDIERKLAISFGGAILDNWFENNDANLGKEEKDKLIVYDLAEIINNRERLYKNYFEMYNDLLAEDTIRVYYPRNGESWIDGDKNCSVDIKINRSKGTEFGFCKIGFSYCLLDEQGNEKMLKIAYIDEGREILRFQNLDNSLIKKNQILWAM